MALDQSQKSFLKKFTPLAALVGGLCCLSPIILVLFGLSTVSFASSLGNTLYGTYKWAFRGAALLFLAAGLFWYFYKKEGICTIDAAKRNRTKIINTVLLTLIIGIALYILWLYVILHYIGVWLNIWS